MVIGDYKNEKNKLADKGGMLLVARIRRNDELEQKAHLHIVSTKSSSMFHSGRLV